MQRKNKYCCEEHLDIAFDDFLVLNETFPHLEECKEEVCEYCRQEAKYELKPPVGDVPCDCD